MSDFLKKVLIFILISVGGSTLLAQNKIESGILKLSITRAASGAAESPGIIPLKGEWFYIPGRFMDPDTDFDAETVRPELREVPGLNLKQGEFGTYYLILEPGEQTFQKEVSFKLSGFTGGIAAATS